MKTVLKISGISLLATVVFIIASAVLPYSETFRETSQSSSNPLDVIFLFIVNVFFTVSVAYLGKQAHCKKGSLIFSLIFVYVAMYGFMTQIETMFFGSSFKQLEGIDGWMIMLANSIPFFVIVPLTMKVLNKSYPEENPALDIKLSTILWKVGVLSIIYAFVYFVFGYYVAWQFADLREFYSGSIEKLSFIQMMIDNFNDSNIVPFQILRGVFFSTFILPIIFIFKNNSKQLLIALILTYLSTAIALIVPNFLFPNTVRWAHFIEMTTSMTVFAVITWLIWKKNLNINAQ